VCVLARWQPTDRAVASRVSPSKTIGQYRILRKIGSGGMGAVYLGEHVLLGRVAAIKVLLSPASTHPDVVERFFDEARATSSVSDPGVVQVFDFGYHVDGTAYIVMEYLEGESLASRLARRGRLAPSDALRIARQAATALHAAHQRGIVHRDLKPDNIYLVRDGEAQGGERAKVLDFGIAKLADGSGARAMTESGATLGTPVYMSPEQCRAPRRVDPRSDIYSLGCVLFQMLTGRTPFGGDRGEVIAAHLGDPAPAASTIVPELPNVVDVLLRRCLGKSPDDRYPSMAAVARAIEVVLATIAEPGTASSAPGASDAAPSSDAAPPSDAEVAFFATPAPATPNADQTLTPPPRRGRSALWSAGAILLAGGAVAVVVAVWLARSGGGDLGPRPVDPVHASAGVFAAAPPARAAVVPPTDRTGTPAEAAPHREVAAKPPAPAQAPAVDKSAPKPKSVAKKSAANKSAATKSGAKKPAAKRPAAKKATAKPARAKTARAKRVADKPGRGAARPAGSKRGPKPRDTPRPPGDLYDRR
jgi:eukaryotic-like serine/threonine-protein kinase